MYRIRRPLTTASLAFTGSTIAYAYWIEYQAATATAAVAAASTTATRSTSLESVKQDPRLVQLPREYDWDSLHYYWSHRPVSAVGRVLQIGWYLVPRGLAWMQDFVIQPKLMSFVNRAYDTTHWTQLQQHHASCLRSTLTLLGPAFVKAGQQLSIRPDLLPATVLKELQKLCDEVEPVSNETALKVLREQLNVDDLHQVFVGTPQLVASASLGQVYKAQLKHDDNQTVVAIKVQRPDMLERFSLDLYILQRLGVTVDLLTSLLTNQPPFHKALYESFARGSYQELDYEHEAASQILFRRELMLRQSPVVVPRVFTEYSTRTVLTSEWIQGKKLADSSTDDIRRLIPIGVELFLTQLLDIGTFHAYVCRRSPNP